MNLEIRNKKQLEKALAIFGDYNPNLNYFSKQKVTYKNVDGYMYKQYARLFTIFGCTHISEAARFINEEFSLFISSDDILAAKVEESGEDGLEINDINRPFSKSKITSRGKSHYELCADSERAAQFCK